MKRFAHLAVAISTLDRPASLARCLDALSSGDVLPAELVIVDQSHSDTTQNIVEEYRIRNTRIVYFREEQDGLAASQNAAIRNANYPIVAVIDDDCIPEHRWLAVVEKSFASLETLAALTGRVLPLRPEGERLYPVSSRTSNVRAEFKGKSSPWVVGSGNNFAVKREWFIGVGGCDERLGPGSPGQGGVDMDLFYRLLRAGGHIRYEPDMLVYHERQDKTGRIARRPMYGHGMGACCTIWLRQRDFYALHVLVNWLSFRVRLLARAVWRRQWMSAHEELLILRGTIFGLKYGLFAPDLHQKSFFM